MRDLFLFISCIIFPAFSFNICSLYLDANPLKPKDNTLTLYLNQKNVIFSEKGAKTTEFFSSSRESCFWNFMGISQLKTQNFSYQPNIIELIPNNTKKACFSYYNVCAYWFDNESFTDFYLIEPISIIRMDFKKTTFLLSPRLFSYLKEKDSR
jgi:hypothetical protein